MAKIYRNIMKLIESAWVINYKFFIILIFNVIFTIIYSITMIRIPTIVLTMVQKNEVRIDVLAITFSILAGSAWMASMCKVWYTPTGIRIRYHYLLKIMKQQISIPFADYENTHNQKNTWNIYRGVTSIDGIQAFYENMGMLSGSLSIVLISVVIIFELSPVVALLSLFWFVVYTYLSIQVSNETQKSFNDNIHFFQEHWYVSDVGIDVAYGKEIRVFQISDWISKKIKNVNSKLRVIVSKNATRTMNVALLDDTYQLVRDGIVYVFLIVAFYREQISLPEFASFGVLLMQFNRALTSSSNNVKALLSHHDKYEMMFEYLDLKQVSNEGIIIHENLVTDKQWVIEFKNVDFKYPNTDRYIFRDLNFKIEKGRKIAIVGLNGAGKTTLLTLLMRLYKPTAGTITLNDIDIQQYHFESYISLFAPVFQEINVFPYTIKENLVFDKDVDEDLLIDALRNAGIDNNVISKEQLYCQELTRFLNPDGRVLSGGQAQKLVTARAYAHQRPIIILDEPTSALDSLAEHDFYERISATMDDNSILFVSHRLASTRFCDEIILIENDCILEQGTHKQLMDLGGRYHELFELQAKYYKEGTPYEEKV